MVTGAAKIFEGEEVKNFLINLGKHIEGKTTGAQQSNLEKLLEKGLKNELELKDVVVGYEIAQKRGTVGKLKYDPSQNPNSGLPQLEYGVVDNKNIGAIYKSSPVKDCVEKGNFSSADEWFSKIVQNKATNADYSSHFIMHHIINIDEILTNRELRQFLVWVKENKSKLNLVEVEFNSSDNIILLWKTDHAGGHIKYNEAINVVVTNILKQSGKTQKQKYQNLINFIVYTRKNILDVVIKAKNEGVNIISEEMISVINNFNF
jgi:hypothetical protein